MTDVNFENLGQLGLMTDKEPYELPPEAWSRADNINFDHEGASSFLGHEEALVPLLHAPYWLFPWKSSAGFSWLYVGLARVGRILGVNHSDVTRYTTSLGDDDYTAVGTSIFSGTLLGDLPLWTYSGQVDPPQAWSGSRFQDLPNWQASSFCDILTVVDRHVVAMRVKRSGIDFNPRMVKWSQPADPGTYPNSWDEADPATTAGEITLAETQGEIITTALLNNVTLIYKEDSIISMRFVGGQSVFAFDTEFSQFGAISRNAVGILENSHLVVTQGDVILHDGATFKSVINDINKALLFDNLDATLVDLLMVRVRVDKNEVWICYADINNAGFINKALVWNYEDLTWSQRDMDEFSHVASGYIDTSAVSQIIDDQSALIIDNALMTYDSQPATPVFDDLAAIKVAGSKLYKLNSTQQFDGTNIACRLERTGLAVVGRDRFGEWRTDLNSTKFIRRIFFKMISSGSLSIYVGAQEKVNGAVAWQGPYAFDPSTDNYIDVNLNTKFFGIRLESEANIFWSLQAYTLDLEVIGAAP